MNAVAEVDTVTIVYALRIISVLHRAKHATNRRIRWCLKRG